MNFLKRMSPLFALGLIVGNFTLTQVAKANVGLEELTLIEETAAPVAVNPQGDHHHHHHGHHHHGHHHHSHWTGLSATATAVLPSPNLALN